MIFAIVACVMVLCLLLLWWVERRWGEGWWTVVLSVITMPLSVIVLLLLMTWELPYCWLYPERYAHFVDFHGTDAQRLALKKYREEAARRTFIRRVIEAVRLRPYSGPSYPEIPDAFPEEHESTRS